MRRLDTQCSICLEPMNMKVGGPHEFTVPGVGIHKAVQVHKVQVHKAVQHEQLAMGEAPRATGMSACCCCLFRSPPRVTTRS